MLEDVPPWNTPPFDSVTDFAKIGIGNFTPTGSRPKSLFTGHILQNWGFLCLPSSVSVPASQEIYTPFRKNYHGGFSHTENTYGPLLPFCLEKMEDQYTPLKLECSGKRLIPTQANPLAQELSPLKCKLIFLPFWTYYQGQMFGVLYT